MLDLKPISQLPQRLFKQIEIFGDSIMKGVMLDGGGRYYVPKESVVSDFGREFDCVIDNRSRFGCTIDKGCAMLERSLESGAGYGAALLEYGGNDCDFKWDEVARTPMEEHLPHTPLPVFIKTYYNMIELLRKNGVQPIIMNLPPINAHDYLEWITHRGVSRDALLVFLRDEQRIYRYQEMYSCAVTKIAHETGSLFVDVRSAFLYNDRYTELMCADGIHPNQNGQRLIKDVFVDFAAQLKGAMPPSLA